MKNLLSVLLCLFMAGNAGAQAAPDHIKWTYVVSKESGTDEYTLIFHATLDPGWHIFSQNPGGDGMLIPPTFKFDKNTALVGTVRETGVMHTAVMDGIDGKVAYYEDKVDFIQTVKGRKGAPVTASHQFQICSNEMCLPPKTLTHTFTLP
jgi:thiol:disulfide interchange protein DsbD